MDFDPDKFGCHSREMESDGHFLSFATIALGLVLLFVLSLGGLFIYLFLTQKNVDTAKSKDIE